MSPQKLTRANLSCGDRAQPLCPFRVAGEEPRRGERTAILYLDSTNVLNAIISGEPLQVERKYRDPVTVIPRRKIAWAMNELSRVADAN
jgi:hypothetical protein